MRQYPVPELYRYLVMEGHKKQTAAFSGMPKLSLTISPTDFSLLAIFKSPAQPMVTLLCASSQTPERSCTEGSLERIRPSKDSAATRGQVPLCSHCRSHVRCSGEASTSRLDNCSVKLNRAKEKVCQTCDLDILQAAHL